MDMEKDTKEPMEKAKCEKAEIDNSVVMIRKVLGFLQLFVCATLAKRLVSIILLAVGMSNGRVTELTGMCDKSVRTLKKALSSGEISNLFHVGGGGSQGKLDNISDAIVWEIEHHDYHSKQQIADMVEEKFGIKVSRETIRRLLKKTESDE